MCETEKKTTEAGNKKNWRGKKKKQQNKNRLNCETWCRERKKAVEGAKGRRRVQVRGGKMGRIAEKRLRRGENANNGNSIRREKKKIECDNQRERKESYNCYCHYYDYYCCYFHYW